MAELIESLRAGLPNPATVLENLKHKGAGEMAGPCPICGGTDRFYVRADGSFGCRGCNSRGGDKIDFFRWLHSADLKELADRYLDPIPTPKPPQKQPEAAAIPANLTKEYLYTDEAGRELFRVRRFEEPGKRKTFRQGHYAGGQWTPSLKDVRRVLYRLPEVLKADRVFLVEGEKDADNLRNLGVTATTAPCGSGGWRPEYTEALAGKTVLILPDNDQAGRKYAETVAGQLSKADGFKVKIVNLPGLPEKGDASDWLKAGGTREDLEKLASEAAEQQPKKTAARCNVVELQDFLSLEFPPRENVLSPWLPSQGLAMIYAYRGIGKTHLSLGIAYAVASGGSFLGWEAPRPEGVLFLDGEMPARLLQERLAHIAVSSDREPAAPLRILTPDLQSNGMLDLSQPDDQKELEPYLKDTRLVIVDNLSTLCRSGRENEAESWLPVQGWALSQRAQGRSVLFIHHGGKAGTQRGTSRKEDVLDAVISLKRPGDYTPDQGACFEVHFEKARGIFGPDTKAFEAQLVSTPDGRQAWTTKPLEESNVEKVAKLLNEGIPQGEIAELLDVAKGTVSKAKKQAKEAGLLRMAS